MNDFLEGDFSMHGRTGCDVLSKLLSILYNLEKAMVIVGVCAEKGI